ncbi:MAG: hypothetical protein D6677_10955 [Calditrichaeota bacterium]|nr:MAG: hypothetical protein D6677_10955 [Calditrichota bacterium]
MNKWLTMLLLLPLLARAQFQDLVEKDPEPVFKKHRGFAYSLVETGSGLGFFYETPLDHPHFFHIGGVFDALIIRDSGQIDFYDPYYGYVTYGKKNNVFLLDMLATVKWRLLPYTMDDSFRPFVSAGAGVAFGMNFPETSVDVPLENQYLWAPEGVIGAGIDADVEGKTYVGVRVQYRIIPFSEKLGERSNHSMLDLRLEIGQRF